VSPFRLFSRAAEPELAPASTDGVSWASGPWDGEPRPATRHARPVAFGSGHGPGNGLGDGVEDDPPTDPHGFPPIPTAGAMAGAPMLRRVGTVRSRPAPAPDPDPLEAAALAAAFAADYLSWDENDPGRRGRALADHLAAPVGDPTLLGWDGRGRQRADFALPGLVRPDGDDRVLVDVRVRVTPYRAVGTSDDRTADVGGPAEPEPDVLGVPAAAPAPTGRGWRGCASFWVRLSVPVVREDGRLVVDAAEETADLVGDPAGRLDRDPPDALDRDLSSDHPGATPGAPVGGTPGYAEVHELREGPRAPAERVSRPVPEPESAW
jgi:hypothetical protein